MSSGRAYCGRRPMATQSASLMCLRMERACAAVKGCRQKASSSADSNSASAGQVDSIRVPVRLNSGWIPPQWGHALTVRHRWDAATSVWRVARGARSREQKKHTQRSVLRTCSTKRQWYIGCAKRMWPLCPKQSPTFFQHVAQRSRPFVVPMRRSLGPSFCGVAELRYRVAVVTSTTDWSTTSRAESNPNCTWST